MFDSFTSWTLMSLVARPTHTCLVTIFLRLKSDRRLWQPCLVRSDFTYPPNPPQGGHPSHSNLVRGKLTSPAPNPAGDGTSIYSSLSEKTRISNHFLMLKKGSIFFSVNFKTLSVGPAGIELSTSRTAVRRSPN